MVRLNKIAVIVLSFLVALLVFISFGAYDFVKYKVFQEKEVPEEFYVCFRELDKTLDEADRVEFKETKEEELYKYHFGLGSYIRNNWINNDGLNINLENKLRDLGVSYADGMSSVIITSYHRYLNNENIRLRELVEKNGPAGSANHVRDMDALQAFAIIQLLIYTLLLMLKNKLNFTM